jgi:hypothetical protein
MNRRTLFSVTISLIRVIVKSGVPDGLERRTIILDEEDDRDKSVARLEDAKNDSTAIICARTAATANNRFIILELIFQIYSSTLHTIDSLQIITNKITCRQREANNK